MSEPFSAVNREKYRESVLAEGLLASRRREFSAYYAPFPVIRNRELSGN